ncbi:MAG: transporter substrate-binding domain-containing protein [Treponema sp.]|nr:transporter substrate-binding domain-containing protein [Treponema sp.]
MISQRPALAKSGIYLFRSFFCIVSVNIRTHNHKAVRSCPVNIKAVVYTADKTNNLPQYLFKLFISCYLAIRIGVDHSNADAVEASPEFKASLNSITEFKDNVTALNDLEIGGVDGVVMDSVVANYVIKTTGKPFTIIHDTLASEQYGVAFRKGDVKLSEKVQAVLEEMEADGTVAELSRKWFGANISVIGK